jgi:zinc/manganese transport system substrate-binding protein
MTRSRIARLAAGVFALASAALPRPAQAALKVVSSIPILGSLAKEVGGDRVEVQSLAKGYQDPHFVEAKPSLMLVLNRADLLLHVGLELEIGWLPPLVLGSRNPRIQTGELGNLDCSQSIPVLDVPRTRVDRSMGDIHPQGNPHYWLPPSNARLIAKVKEWQPLIGKLRGTKVATYHKSWTYVAYWLGLVEVGYVEIKPGIPPDPSHLVQLIATLKREGAKLLLMENFYNKTTAQLVADKSGARLLVLPTDVGATPEAKDWFSLVGLILEELTR